jgi:hypothetical protein
MLLNSERTLLLLLYFGSFANVNSRFVKYNHWEMGRIIIIFL